MLFDFKTISRIQKFTHSLEENKEDKETYDFFLFIFQFFQIIFCLLGFLFCC